MLVFKRETIPELNLPIPGKANNILEDYHKPNIHGNLAKDYKLEKFHKQNITLPDFNISHAKKQDHISIPRYDLEKSKITKANDTKFFKELYGFIDIKQKPALNPVYFEKDLKGRKPVDVLLANLSAQAEGKDNDDESKNDEPITSTKDLFMKSFRERFIGKREEPAFKKSLQHTHETPKSHSYVTPKKRVNITPVALGDEQSSIITKAPLKRNRKRPCIVDSATTDNVEPTTGAEPTDAEKEKTQEKAKRTNRKTPEIVSELLQSEGFEVSNRVIEQIKVLSNLTKQQLMELIKQKKTEFKKGDTKPVLIKRLIKKASNIAQRIEKEKDA